MYNRSQEHETQSSINAALEGKIQNELILANQLLERIAKEIKAIKELTRKGGQFETNVMKSAETVAIMGQMQGLSLEIDNAPVGPRHNVEDSNVEDQNMSYERHETFRNDFDDSN